MHTLLQDLRYAIRTFRKNALLTAVILASLAIGIGANSAIFSVVDALLLRPLPYPSADRLAAVWLHSPRIGIFRDWPSPGQYIDIQDENHSFDEMALAQSRLFTLTGREQPERLSGLRTQSSLMRMLGAKPMFGRLLLPQDDKPGSAPAAILSYPVWVRLFNSDPKVIGKTITLDGNPYTVAGVLRRGFMMNAEVMPSEGPMDNVDIFLPLPLGTDAMNSRRDENYNILARLKPGVSIQQAQVDINIIANQIRKKDHRDSSFGMDVVGLQNQVVGAVRRVLLVLFGSVALVLLIACVNVANLLLTRAAGREKEVAIRTALGAGWKQIARHLLTESVLLGLLGGAAGLLVARFSSYIVTTMNPGNIPRLDDVRISGAVLAFTLAVSLATGILFGMAPVWHAIRVDLNNSLKAGGRTGQADGGLYLRKHRLRGLLVVSELALSLMLLIGAGLLIRSFEHLQNVPPGFTADHVLTMQVAADDPKYRDDKAVVGLYQQMEDGIAQLPGVTAEGVVSVLPLTGSVGWGGINVEGYTPPAGQELQVDIRVASEHYFTAMEIPLIKGRFFAPTDKGDSPNIMIIDQKFADRFWPSGDAIGKHLWFNPKKPYTIVGVVGAVKQYGLDADSKIATYFPRQQAKDNDMFLAVRTSTDPAAMSSAVVGEIRSVDPTVAVYRVRTMDDLLHDSLARQRFSTTMLGAFAAFALLLAAIGLYGVLSHLVTQSTHDIGIMMTLGAQPGKILGLVMRQGLELTAVGIVAGLAGAAMLTHLMSSLLFGVSALDLVTFGAVPVIFALVALTAALIPAWRAIRVDPMIALRAE